MLTYSIMALLVIASALLIGCSEQQVSNEPRIELSTDSFDLGDINPDEGNRIETFYVKNIGESQLDILSVSTSCGCTEAEVETEHIPPGEQTKLTVVYDPSVHPGLVGKIKRIVYIKSNDPLQEEIELELVGDSLPSKKTETKEDNHDEEGKDEELVDDHDEGNENLQSDFEISPAALYNKIKSDKSIKILDVREDFEYEENHIKDALLLSVNKINQEELDKLGLKKDDEIILYCRSGKRSAKAYDILSALGYTNVKSMYGGIVHWLEDDYPIETGTADSSEQIVNLNDDGNNDIQKKAKIELDKTEYDFGQIPQSGGMINTTFEVRNTGDKELTITSVSTSCGCTSAELEELVVPPGESTILTVFFDPDFHEEPKDRFSRTVFLETNDISRPEIEVKIWIDILEGE